MPGRLPRLTRRSEFLRVAGRGKKAARPGLVLQALPSDGPLRLGFTATKKIGGVRIRGLAWTIATFCFLFTFAGNLPGTTQTLPLAV